MAVVSGYFVYAGATGSDGGNWVAAVIFGTIAALLGVQAIAPIRDLVGGPAETTGTITRRWSRTDSLLFKSYYARVDTRILRFVGDVRLDLVEGTTVAVRYYPHSSIVIRMEKT
jgi:hypothetical protein